VCVTGGIALGKAFQINRTLKSLIWDRNGTRYAGAYLFFSFSTNYCVFDLLSFFNVNIELGSLFLLQASWASRTVWSGTTCW
jgi:hypothetical protein